MVQLTRLISLPPTLLGLITLSLRAVAAELEWPINLPANEKYFPEDAPLVKRGLEAMQRAVMSQPVGARKMTDNEEEMFFLDYWQFENDEKTSLSRRSSVSEYQNSTLDTAFLPPLLLHAPPAKHSPLRNHVPALFKRDFQCPTGTNSCPSIGRPNSCCATGETCVLVPDTGVGDVGCCPSGQSCTNAVTPCDTNAGYKSCPGQGGGCCIPGYECFGAGCASGGRTSTTTTTGPAVTVTSCIGGYFTCPASLGGGCCLNGQICGTSNTCLGTSTSSSHTTSLATIPTTADDTRTVAGAPGAPARPTSGSSPSITDSSAEATAPRTTTVGTQVVAICPTNYYFCSAYYRPGCCRIGRDCALSECPAAASTSTIVSNGVTVLVPGTATTGGSSYVSTALITASGELISGALRGSCQTAWSTCPPEVGGGCCPPNFACGASCTATGGGATGTVGKLPPTGGVARAEYSWQWQWACVGAAALVLGF